MQIFGLILLGFSIAVLKQFIDAYKYSSESLKILKSEGGELISEEKRLLARMRQDMAFNLMIRGVVLSGFILPLYFVSVLVSASA